MKFVNILLVSATIMTSVVDATEPRMAEVYKKYDIQEWDNLPEITPHSIYNFFAEFWELFNKLKGRHYTKPLKRPQRGPMKFMEHKTVTSLW